MFALKKSWFVTASIALSVFLAGCGTGEAVENVAQYTSTVETIDIPNDVKVIGFGEATHGNIEFHELKKDLFQALVENEDVRVFVLEGDFGGAQQINQFILTGNGTAEEAVNALDYKIYQTEQMIALVQWMHDYNRTVDENEQVYFYGNDMQRYDYSKIGLLDYYEKVNGDAAKGYVKQLEHVSNETMRELTNSQLQELDATMDTIISDLQLNSPVYRSSSSEESFALALQYAQIMKQRTQLFLNDSNYAHLRDQYLAENLQWIVDFEAARGHDKVLISAHNGHIEKTSASLAGYKAMGDYLEEIYGEAYFSIGTDFIDNTFQALNGSSGERKNYTLEHHNDLVDAFSGVEENVFYVDFEQASTSKELATILSTEQKMGNIGDDFRSWYKFAKMFYTIEMIPNEAYDGLIIVKEATPTTVIE
ncbi:erythromycin esterase family protein [Solibacillus cecembensis]|uniref:erythromycin esterase family protein n=1 Tax=Solibacillus cecembensis TaxID=459347 RepID=UPI003D07ACA6